MRERTHENRLREEVKKLGGLAVKINPLGLAGWPDRLIILPGGFLEFVELKADAKYKPKPHQLRVHELLRRLGQKVAVVAGKDQTDNYIKKLKSIC